MYWRTCVMRLMISESKNAKSLYAIKSVYQDGKRSTKIVERLGTLAELSKIHDDPILWAKQYIAELTEKEKNSQREVILKCHQSKRLTKDEQHFYNGGYLFLQDIYHKLGLHEICRTISDKYRFSFNLDSILSRLVYSRIIFPASKLSTYQLSGQFLEQPDFEIQHIYRALEVLAKQTDFIQSQLYRNSLAISKRNDRVLYYDCTNFFFETEQEEGLKQYGPSKEHRPSPIIEMGLFMDGDGIPLAFCIHSGNTNEQTTLKPLEQTIMQDFHMARFVVCTDAGLSSTENRKFNNAGKRAFVTTQSIKKLKKHLRGWALEKDGWLMFGDAKKKTYHLDELEKNEETAEKFRNATFFRERWIKEDGLEQKLIVTYSIKYRNYQRQIRNSQIERAAKLISGNPSSIKKHHQNDFKRFISQTVVTSDGEVADKDIFCLNTELIESEEMYDGFYAVCTNLEDEAPSIVKINHRRWEIEECFRIMKSEFKARPVYLKRDDRIKAHFTTCFLALTVYRYLEKKLEEKFTSSEIIQTLRDMNFYAVAGEGYIPTYTRTGLTDALHSAFGFHTDYQIVTTKQMKKIFKDTKK